MSFIKKIICRIKETESYFFFQYFVFNIDGAVPYYEYPKILITVIRIVYTRVYSIILPSLFQDHYNPKPYLYNKNKDFGNLVYKGLQHLVYPKSIEALQEILINANLGKTPINFCGSAHSSNGLTLSGKGGIRLYLKKIPATFRMVDKNIVEFRGTATIKQLGKFLNEHKKALPVVGDQLHLTLGGYLSAGGVGYNSVEYGFLSDHVVKLDVLTADGSILHCSEKENSNVFHAVLGGQGQLGVIIAAQIKVIEQKPLYLRMDYCYLKSIEQLSDILNKSVSQKFSYLIMFVTYFKGTFDFSFLTGKSFEDENTTASLKKSINFVLGNNHKPIRKTHKVSSKYNRITVPTGYNILNILTHEWMWSEYILPLSKFNEIWQDIEPLLKIKQSTLYLYIIKNKKISQHSFLGRNNDYLQDTSEPLVMLGLLYSFYGLDSEALQNVKGSLDHLYQVMIKKGAKPYYHGYHPQLKEKDMRCMYPKFDAFLALKSSLDPHGILNPGWITKDI